MLLLTGATGRVGAALLPLLLERGTPVRCLVRDPRRLGGRRVRVHIALGDLADPGSFRHALRGVQTVVHLAAAWRDQPGASVEELDGLATWRLLRSAEAAGAERFAFLSPLGAAPDHPLRAFRAKALAEQAVAASSLRTSTLRCSLIYRPGERRPAVVPRPGDARVQPVAAADVAACLLAALERPGVHEIAGPHELSWRGFVALAAGRRPLPVPPVLLRPALRAYETLAGPAALHTWDDAARALAPMTTPRGTADAEALGVRPLPPGAAQKGGLRSAHGRAASSCAAS